MKYQWTIDNTITIDGESLICEEYRMQGKMEEKPTANQVRWSREKTVEVFLQKEKNIRPRKCCSKDLWSV